MTSPLVAGEGNSDGLGLAVGDGVGAVLCRFEFGLAAESGEALKEKVLGWDAELLTVDGW
jgi:hypothetical protein